MIQPADLHRSLVLTDHAVHTKGDKTWRRLNDWTRPERISNDEGRGGGLGSGKNDRALEEQMDDKQAAAYKAELDKLTERIDNDLARLRRLIDIANPDTPKTMEAGCQSCHRDEGRYEPVHAGRYRSACRFCGEWRSAEGEWPPLAVIRWRHRNPGKRVPLHVVERAS